MSLKKFALACLFCLVSAGLGASFTYIVQAKEQAAQDEKDWARFKRKEQEFNQELVVLGPGEIKFATFARGTIAVDGGKTTLVDGAEYLLMKPDGSGTYTAQHTFTVKERAVIRLDHGYFDFAVKEHGFVFVDNGGKVEITGEGKATVNKDGHMFLLGEAKFKAHGLPAVSVIEGVRDWKKNHLPVGELEAKYCETVLFNGELVNDTADGEVVVSFDQATATVVSKKKSS